MPDNVVSRGRFQQYTRSVLLDPAVEVVLAPADPKRVAVGFLNNTGNPRFVSVDIGGYNQSRMLMPDSQLLWFHWEKYFNFVQLEFRCTDKSINEFITVFEVYLIY